MKNYKVTPECFVEQVKELYKQAREVKVKVNNSIIKRGRSHSISSHTEDLFAAFLAENLGKYKYFIDQPITIQGKKNAIYPDIAIVDDNNRIVNLLDLKMDLGFNRKGFVDFCMNKESLIEEIRNKSCHLKDGVTKEDEFLELDENIKYHVVIISDTNISREQLNENLEGTRSLKNVCVYCLTSNEHPNTYKKNKSMNIKVNTKEFDKLINNLL